MPNATTTPHPHAARKPRIASSPSQRVRPSRPVAVLSVSQRNDVLAVLNCTITAISTIRRGDLLDIDFRQLRGNPFFSSFRDQLDVFIHVTSSCSSNCCAPLYACARNPYHGRCNYLWFVLQSCNRTRLRQKHRQSRPIPSNICICGYDALA